MEITIEQIKSLRSKTGLAISLCKEALTATNGDEEKAIEYLEKKSLLNGSKASSGNCGIIRVYEHPGSKIGVIVEIGCNTDFVAKNEEFQKFATNVALQIAAMNPSFVSFDDVGEKIISFRKDVFLAQLGDTVAKKPPQAIEAILAGKLKKWASENCLLQQTFFNDEDGKSKTIKEMQDLLSVKFGEKIEVKRFKRFEV